ncbi:hypothetical protein PMAYCL1PPCAC_00053, partial [Pristionchus mayeri]
FHTSESSNDRIFEMAIENDAALLKTTVTLLEMSSRLLNKLALSSLDRGEPILRVRALCESEALANVRQARTVLQRIQSIDDSGNPRKLLIPVLAGIIALGERTLELCR